MPIVVSLFIIPVAVLCLFTAAATFTAAKSITATVPTPSFGGSFENTTIVTHQYELDNWRTAANIYTLFMFLWAVGFIHAIGFMVIAFCGVFWYWSGLGDDKMPDVGALFGAKLALQHHLGTIIQLTLTIIPWHPCVRQPHYRHNSANSRVDDSSTALRTKSR